MSSTPRPVRGSVPTIRSRLTWLIAACMVPVALAAALWSYLLFEHERTQLNHKLLLAARALALSVDRELTANVARLQALATSPHIATEELTAFFDQAGAVLHDSHGHAIQLHDRDGRLRVSTLGPNDLQPWPSTPSDLVQGVLEGGRPLVSGLIASAIDGEPLILVAVPVRHRDQAVAVLSMTLRAKELDRVLAEQRLPESWVSRIYDASGLIVGHNRNPQHLVGKRGRPELLRVAAATHEGLARSTLLNGTDVFNAFSHAPTAGWHVAVGAPTAELQAAAWSALSWTLGATLTLLTLALLLAWHLARRTADSIRALTLPALALGLGEEVKLPPLGLQEADEVAASLREAAQLLRQRTRERDDADQALAAKEREIRSLAANVPDNILRADLEGRMLYVNPALERTLGRSAAELLGRCAAGHITLHEAILRVGRSGKAEELELTTPGPDGVPCQHEVRLVPESGADGKPVSVLAVGRDITERKQVEQALAAAKEAAEQASRAKSMFLANMSHEIRTPLNGIIGLARLLEDGALAPRERDYMEKILASAQLLLGILNDILDFSRIEAGAVRLERSHFSLHDVLDAIAMIAAPPRGKEVEVLFDLAADVPTALTGDVLRLQQVLLNLIGNAVKFTDAGEVVVSVRLLALSPQQATLEFAVRDTGIGIPPEQQHNLFEAFSQAEPPAGRRYGGSGLGLAICARLATLLGGHITFSSAAGRGSQFDFVAPFALAPADSVPPLPRDDLAGLRVLVVADNAAAREVLLGTCATFRWQATALGSAREALAWLRGDSAAVDVMLLDWRRRGSADLARLAREAGAAGIALPRLVLMAPAWATARLTASRAPLPIDATVAKPVTPAALFTAVRRAVTGANLAEPAAAAAPAPLDGMRLLVAEDNEINQIVLRDVLTRAGAQIEMAADGVEAVEILRRDGADAFHAVLMDMRMPRMNGYEATRVIREELGMTALPIIALTASALPADREQARRAGMAGHIAKPFDNEELLDTLATHYHRRAPRRAARAATVQELAGIDMDKALGNVGGSQGKLLELLGRLAEMHDDEARQVRDLLASGQHEEAATRLHSIRGAAGYLGAGELWRIASAAEEAIARGDLDTVAALLEELEAALAQLRATVERAVPA